MLKRSKVMVRRLVVIAALTLCAFGSNARGGMVITEWEYNGAAAGNIGEFVEFTNTGNTPVDMSGYSFDDNTRTPGSQNLSAFGMVAPGESVLLTDNTEANFRANWSLAPSIRIIVRQREQPGPGR
jgi:hypothetical protein